MKHQPVILKVLNVLSYVTLCIFILAAVISLYALFLPNPDMITLLTITLYFGSASVFLFGFYQIVKAACIYIEKNEKQSE